MEIDEFTEDARVGAALDTIGAVTAGWLMIGCGTEVVAIAIVLVFDLVLWWCLVALPALFIC